GYRYASVGWPGMIGVLSGMNERGLTVTLNAAEGPIPTSSAMPVSLLARHMLQYAATLDEARAIADTCRTFVSESFLVTAACGREAAVIEKTPERQALFVPEDDMLLCTNHYQSAAFADDPVNRANIADSDSEYRRLRLAELLAGRAPLDPVGAVEVLRDRRGLGGRDIGLTNEKSIDQCLAHHSVVFQPEHGLMWVSTGPWQAGAYLCYDLKRIFGGGDPTPAGFADTARTIAADSEFLQRDYLRVCDYRRRAAVVRQALASGEELAAGYADSLVAANPEYFESHALQGDYFYEQKDYGRAIRSWWQALDREIPRRGQREELERKITRYDKKQ
ncbi:MAG: C45 family peptidase, partial [Alistipes sp.]|nr:C45 family peptidase [Alistipes sp.]